MESKSELAMIRMALRDKTARVKAGVASRDAVLLVCALHGKAGSESLSVERHCDAHQSKAGSATLRVVWHGEAAHFKAQLAKCIIVKRSATLLASHVVAQQRVETRGDDRGAKQSWHCDTTRRIARSCLASSIKAKLAVRGVFQWSSAARRSASLSKAGSVWHSTTMRHISKQSWRSGVLRRAASQSKAGYVSRGRAWRKHSTASLRWWFNSISAAATKKV